MSEDFRHPVASVFAAAAEAVESGVPCALATLVEAKGHTPREAGTMMLVRRDGTIAGTIGGGPFEASVIVDAQAAIASGETAIREYTLTQEELLMYCQGRARVLIQPFAVRRRLVIFGAGHVGQALCRLAVAARLFHVTLVDDRPEMLASPDAALADAPIHAPGYKDLPSLGPECDVCVLTRCHATDKEILRWALSGEFASLGMIGSEAKWRAMGKELAEEGITKEALSQVQCPIGLYKSGKSPEEVAVSILAGLLR